LHAKTPAIRAFITFLNAVERAVPAGKVIHAVLDNYATHKHPRVKQWLADNPRCRIGKMPFVAPSAITTVTPSLLSEPKRQGNFRQTQSPACTFCMSQCSSTLLACGA
jgi:hypothetical protein